MCMSGAISIRLPTAHARGCANARVPRPAWLRNAQPVQGTLASCSTPPQGSNQLALASPFRLQEEAPHAAGEGGEALEAAQDEAAEAWDAASNGERAAFERQAEGAVCLFPDQWHTV